LNHPKKVRGALSLKRPNHSSLATLAYEAIVEAVVDRRLEPGARLSIETLATQLEMSNTPVREALMRTVAERLVIQDRNRGFTVAPLLSGAAYHQLFEVRHLLELHAIRTSESISKTVDHLMQLVATMSAMEHGPDYRDFRAFSKADAEFHYGLVAMSDNVFLMQSWDNLHFHLHVGRLYAGSGVIDFRDAISEHTAIVKALQTGDKQHIVEIVDNHISCAERRLRILVTAALTSKA
jgi:DNA-binding GntR family transcriptional regulator